MTVVHELAPGVDAVGQARVDLAAVLQLLARFDLNEGVDNHVTLRAPGTTDRFLFNPRGKHWSLMAARDILVLDAEGNVVEGDGLPVSTGPKIHIPIHQAHPRGGCVLHTHSPWATALATIKGGRLAMCSQNSIRFYEDTAYDDDFNGIATGVEEGRRMAAVMGDKTVLFLACHGVVCVADTVAEAFDHMYYLERSCQVQLLAMSSGQPFHTLPEELCRTAKGFFDKAAAVSGARHLEALKRVLDREDSDYAR